MPYTEFEIHLAMGLTAVATGSFSMPLKQKMIIFSFFSICLYKNNWVEIRNCRKKPERSGPERARAHHWLLAGTECSSTHQPSQDSTAGPSYPADRAFHYITQLFSCYFLLHSRFSSSRHTFNAKYVT